MERRFRECEAKKRDREKYHLKRAREMKAKHESAKNKHKACKKDHEHNQYLQKNYKSMFKMVRSHADDLKAQRDKARTKSEAMLEQLSAYQKKCGDLEVNWQKKLHVQDKKAERARLEEKGLKKKAEILAKKLKKLGITYKELERKKGESTKKFKARLKELTKHILDEKARLALRLRRKKK